MSSFWLTLLAAGPMPSGVATNVDASVNLRIEREEVTFLLVEDALEVTAEGPNVLELRFHTLAKRKRKRATGQVTLEYDGKPVGRWGFEPQRGSVRVVPPRGRSASPMYVRLIELPRGKHSFRLLFDAGPKTTFAVRLEQRGSVAPGLSLGTIPAPTPPPAPPDPEPDPEPEPVPAPAPMPTPIPEPEPEPLELTGSDGTVAGAAELLAATLTHAVDERKFHRVAVPYFQELGAETSERHLGRLIAELIAVELTTVKGLVVIERERLDQIMREHRLKDLGVVDETTATEFGRVLGAQSLLSGTVAEAGTEFIITVKQVEVATGRVMVAGKIPIARAGLIALSDEVVVTRTRSGAALRSALLPGWGQLYNREPVKGWGLLCAGLAALGTAGTFTALRFSTAADYDALPEGSPANAEELRERGNDYAGVANVAWVVYGTVWAASLLDALINGTDSTDIELGVASPAAVSFTF